MVEYGNGVSQVSGKVAGPHAISGSGGGDWGANLSQIVTDTTHTISTMPPGQLVLLVIGVVIGLMLLRRAF